MAKAPTPEEAARYILSIFLKFNRRAGDVLSSQNFSTEFFKAPWKAADFKLGMEYAAQQDWVEVLDGNSFRLTDKGFAEA